MNHMATKEKNTIIMRAEDMAGAIDAMAQQVLKKNKGSEGLAVVGIRTRGVFVARRLLAAMLKDKSSGAAGDIPFGILDITLYRDDVSGMSVPKPIKETDIPFDLTGKKIILVDDVIFTGRSIRAAIDELMDFGRPQSIQLAVLVDRGNRELPIEPNFVGKRTATSRAEKVVVAMTEVDGQDQVTVEKKSVQRIARH
jgi:pyrimidine operon attenuation protein/uracil phosphoribosyltransferase